MTMAEYGIRIRKGKNAPWQRGVQFRRAKTPSGWVYWRNTWPNKMAAQLRLNVYRAQGFSGHVFVIPPRAEALDIVERSQWGARAPKAPLTTDDWTDAPLVWHHTADVFRGGDRGDNVDHAKSMQYFHQWVRDWNDLAYNWLVFPNGDVFEGRGWQKRGAGAADPPKQWNAGFIHVAFVGTYTDREPTEAAQLAADQLVAHLRKRGARVPKQIAHGDLMATSCPGAGVRRARKLPR